MNLYEYFDRVAIINLPERKDRLDALVCELPRLSIDIAQQKVQIISPPRPADANGFPSRGVHSNFLSHLGILRAAINDGLRNIWVLEDDAIFSARMCRDQEALTQTLQQSEWDMCFFGHSLGKELRNLPRGLVRSDAEFIWAHCYAVNARALPRLVAYLERALVLPAGHPNGGKLYIDGAFNLFRRFNKDIVTLVANPQLSAQKGSMSNLGHRRWYDSAPLVVRIVSLARKVRDAWWRVHT